MIWDSYVFRRGLEVEEFWDQLFEDRATSGNTSRLLYITGRGFDVRGNQVAAKFVDRVKASRCKFTHTKLVLVGFSGYQLSEELQEQTQRNSDSITQSFGTLDTELCTVNVQVNTSSGGDDDTSTTLALREGVKQVIDQLVDCTEIVLDVSSLPRIAYLTILLALLARILPEGSRDGGLNANGVTFQVLVAEDPELDSKISSEDPSNELVLIPGYSEALQSEALRDLPLVWFPILGENRLGQIRKIEESIPDRAEICPILPHPSRNPRRGDKLLLEYESLLFAKRETPFSNILYAHEGHPFEVYRQLLGAMIRYQRSMSLLGGCRLIVTPLASKLITVGCALACFEMKLRAMTDNSSVAIPYAEPKRYVATIEALNSSRPEISALVLTGDAYLRSTL